MQMLTNLFTNTKYAGTVLNKLKDLKVTTYGINAIGGLADATADWSTDKVFVGIANAAGADLQQRTGADLVTDFAVSLVLGTTLNMANSKAVSSEVKTNLENIAEIYATVHYDLKNATDTKAYTENGQALIKLGDEYKKVIDENMFPGQKNSVEAVKKYIDTVNNEIRSNTNVINKADIKKAPSTEEINLPKAEQSKFKELPGKSPTSTENSVKPLPFRDASTKLDLPIKEVSESTKLDLPRAEPPKKKLPKKQQVQDLPFANRAYELLDDDGNKIAYTDKVPEHLTETIKNITKRTGLKVMFGDLYNTDGVKNDSFRGYFGDDTIVVSKNATKQEVFQEVVMHEFTHSIEGTSRYKDISDFVIKQIYGSDAELNKAVADKVMEYGNNNKTIDEIEARKEIVADNVKKVIFSDDAKSIVEKDYTFGQKIYDVITDLIYRLQKKLGIGELDELKNAQRKYRLALDEVRKNGAVSNNHYSIETIPGTNKKYVKFDRDLKLGSSREEWSKNIEKYIKNNITKNGSITIVTDDGDHIVINGRTAWKIADVEKWENNVKLPMADGELRTKYEAGAHIDELVKISKRGSENKPDSVEHPHEWVDEWNYRTAFFEDSKGDKYRLRISVGINPVESAAYNVGSIQKRGTLRDGPSSANSGGGALSGDTSRQTVYHDKSQKSSTQTTSMEEAFKKAFGKGQFSFATEADAEAGTADVRSKVDIAIERFMSGKATSVEGELFMPGNTANRQAFYKATGVRLPDSVEETHLALLSFNANGSKNNQLKLPFADTLNLPVKANTENLAENILDFDNGNKYNINTGESISIKTINERMEGKKHKVTGVLFEREYFMMNGKLYDAVVPKFDGDIFIRIGEDMYFKSDKAQFKECDLRLRQAISENPELGKQFTEHQLNQIRKGETPEHYTWNHCAEPGKMQLVDSDVHKRTGHTGGRAIWGGGSKYR